MFNFIKSIFNRLYNFFHIFFFNEDNMRSGELIVSEKSSIDIKLTRRHPDLIEVFFADDECFIPCNPHKYDSLEWELHYIDGNYVLRIKWDVGNFRKVNWKIGY